MTGTLVNLGVVTAPGGVLVLAMASWIDYWPELGQPLSHRAAMAAASGGGHVHEWLCEAIAVPAADDQPLPIRASTAPSVFDEQPAIATLETGLGLPWPATAAEAAPVVLGDLPVDRCGMVIGDALALDAWTGINAASTDGLADVRYWGRYADAAHAQFGGEMIPSRGGQRVWGWINLPVARAKSLAAAICAWEGDDQGRSVMVGVDEHTDYYRFWRAAWTHPLGVAAIEVAGCQVLGIYWDPGDYSMRHDGERQYGKVYPVTLEKDQADRTIMRWKIPPYVPEPATAE